jgi:hypothetical protein
MLRLSSHRRYINHKQKSNEPIVPNCHAVKAYGPRRFNSTHSNFRHQTHVSGLLKDPAVVTTFTVSVSGAG